MVEQRRHGIRWEISYSDGTQASEPCYVISVAARMVGVHAQTLRYYERAGLVSPARTRGNIRLFSQRDVSHALWIRTLIEDLGVNLAGVEVVMRMASRMEEMERLVGEMQERLNSETHSRRRVMKAAPHIQK
jgi:MerR family transcriptional regulator/heat shock protein HspR